MAITGPLSTGYYGLGDMTLVANPDINLTKKTSWFYFLSDIDVHTNEEKCDATKKIIHACKKQTHRFILAFTEIKTKTNAEDFGLFFPTINIILKDEIINLIKKKFYDVYIETVPKRVKGDAILRDIEDKKERREKKIELLSK